MSTLRANRELTCPVSMLSGVTRLFMARVIHEAGVECIISYHDVREKWCVQSPTLRLKVYHTEPMVARYKMRAAIQRRRDPKQGWHPCLNCGALLTQEYSLANCLLCGHSVAIPETE